MYISNFLFIPCKIAYASNSVQQAENCTQLYKKNRKHVVKG